MTEKTVQSSGCDLSYSIALNHDPMRLVFWRFMDVCAARLQQSRSFHATPAYSTTEYATGLSIEGAAATSAWMLQEFLAR